jgi:hypothetical protein
MVVEKQKSKDAVAAIRRLEIVGFVTWIVYRTTAPVHIIGRLVAWGKRGGRGEKGDMIPIHNNCNCSAAGTSLYERGIGIVSPYSRVQNTPTSKTEYTHKYTCQIVVSLGRQRTQKDVKPSIC